MEILILALLGPKTPVGANLKCKGEGVVPWLVGAWARPGQALAEALGCQR